MRIERIEIHVTELPVRLTRTFSSGSYDSGPAGQLLGKPVLVKIHAEGVVGVGQVRPIAPGHFVPDTTHGVVAAIREIYGPMLIGRRVADLEDINRGFLSRLPGNFAARAVLDIALHDALGKALGVPVCDLIGGRSQDSIPLEWSVSLYDETSRMVEDSLRAVEEFGMSVLCLKAAGREGWRRDVANFEAVRKAVGDEIVIGVDPNTGWTVAETLRALSALDEMDLGYCEQPVERRNLRGLAHIRSVAGGVPVMVDESLFTLEDSAAIAAAGAADVFCVKLYKVGGLHAARKIYAVGQANDIKVNCGGLAAGSQLEAAAAAHFCASIPLQRSFGAAEFAFGVGVLGDDPLIADGAMRIEQGCVAPPSGPGLGLTIDDGALERMSLHRESVGK
jgi:muconate cycloisomerase